MDNINEADEDDIINEIENVEGAIDNLKSVSGSDYISYDFQEDINLLRRIKKDLQEHVNYGVSKETVEDIVEEFSSLKGLDEEDSVEEIMKVIEKNENEAKDLVGLYNMYSDSRKERSDQEVLDDIYDVLLEEDI